MAGFLLLCKRAWWIAKPSQFAAGLQNAQHLEHTIDRLKHKDKLLADSIYFPYELVSRE